MSRHTQSMLLHYLWKIKVQICDKLQMLCLMKQNISCQVVQQTLLSSSLQQLLEMSTFCPHTCLKTHTLLINCIVIDAPADDVPNIQQTFLQFAIAVQL